MAVKGLSARVVPILRRRLLLRHYVADSASATAPDPHPTETRDPLGLSEEDISKIYSAPNDETKEIFPRGLPKNFRTQIDCFKKTSWILRSQTYDIISQLRDGVKGGSDPCNNFLIHGRDGGGKTICLDQVVHWCWKAGWLVVHIPGVSYWVHSRRELRPSQEFPGTYDQPHEASTWLRNFRTVNAKILKSIKLSEARVWTKRERSEVGDDMLKIIDQSLRKPVIATDVVGVVLEELIREQKRQSSLPDGLKLLLAVDEFNGLYKPCAASVSKSEQIQSHQLNLVKHLRRLIPMGVFPGAVVLSLSRHKTFRYYPPTPSPADVLGEEGVKAVEGYKHIQVDNFSQQEVLNLLNYYQENKWITKEPFEKVLKELWALSDGNPSEITKLSSLL